MGKKKVGKKEHTWQKRPRWHRLPSICPQCSLSFDRDIKALRLHFVEQHGRLPTKGEEHQFKTHGESIGSETPYSDQDFVKPYLEVSGGGCSPR